MMGGLLILIGLTLMLQPLIAPAPRPDLSRLVGVSRALRDAFRADPRSPAEMAGLLDTIGEERE